MDISFLPTNFPSSRIPTDQGIQHPYILKRSETSSPVSYGVPQSPPRHHNPGLSNNTIWRFHSGLENNGSAMGSSLPHYPRYNSYGATQGYVLTPSISPEDSSLAEEPAPLYNPVPGMSPLLTPGSTSIKTESVSRRLPLDWTPRAEPSERSSAFKPDVYHDSKGVGSHYQPPKQSSEPQTNPIFTTSDPTPPSPAYSNPSYRSSPFGKSPLAAKTTTLDDPRTSPGSTEGDSVTEPYSTLIYKALINAPDRRLPLQKIYSWFEENTAKGQDPSKGWQNSIRHNLSMNAGFEAVKEESTAGKKTTNYWRLTDEAVRLGIQSTTRYRKHANYRKAMVSEPPATQRQRSGAKGGKATKIGAKSRGPPTVAATEAGPAGSQYYELCRQPTGLHHPLQAVYFHPPSTTRAMSQAYYGPPATPMRRPAFNCGHVSGCSDPPAGTPVFSDGWPGLGPEYLSPDTASSGGWEGNAPLPNSSLTGPEFSTDSQLGGWPYGRTDGLPA